MKKISLFCLPFAGGSKYSYRKYEQNAPSGIAIIPLEYPGRGQRTREALVTDLDWLIDDLYSQVSSRVDRENYAIYGHSMGGLAAYLLARKIVERGHIPPVHLFITGTAGPSSPSRGEKKRHLLEKKEFIEEIRSLDGCPEEILKNEQLLEFFEPILRADFTATENYQHRKAGPLDIPFTVLTGTQEDLEKADIALWQLETNHTVDFRRLPGNHFFIFESPKKILEIIKGKLMIP